MRIRILVIDDEESYCEILKYNLEKEGYEVDTADSAETALGYDLSIYQLMIVDIMMERLSGFDFAKRVRNNPSTENVPLIFCSALNGEDETVMGLNIGADDYITKPFSMEELVFRMEAILRRVKGKKGKEITMYKIGKFTFDTQKQVLLIDDKVTKLTTKESELLSLLCAHVNEILERNFALKTIWIDDNYFNARSMDVYITKLRKHLKDDPSIEIINIHGKGYKLIAPEVETSAK